MPCTKRTGFCPKASVWAAAGCTAVERNATATKAAIRGLLARACIISPYRCIPKRCGMMTREAKARPRYAGYSAAASSRRLSYSSWQAGQPWRCARMPGIRASASAP